jgi:hypothetical protein
MRYLVSEDQIISQDFPEGVNPPANATIVDGPESDNLALVYLDISGSIKLVPPKPSPSHIWDSGLKKWVESISPSSLPQSLEEAKTLKIQQLYQECDRTLGQFTVGRSNEALSWYAKEVEAKRFLSAINDSGSEELASSQANLLEIAPALKEEATREGMSTTEILQATTVLAQTVVAKAEMLKIEVARIVRARTIQKEEIDKMTDVESVISFSISF